MITASALSKEELLCCGSWVLCCCRDGQNAFLGLRISKNLACAQVLFFFSDLPGLLECEANPLIPKCCTCSINTGWDKLSLLGTDHCGFCDVTGPTADARWGSCWARCVRLSPKSKMTPKTLSGSFETTHFDRTYGENADLSRETRHWIWTKALVRLVPGSPERVSMFLAYCGGGVL